MARETVRIEQLRLRLPGLSMEQARRFGQEVARQVAEGLPAEGRHTRMGAAQVRVHSPASAPRDQLARNVALRILESLR
jgi:hypothetical protein